jgi:hypothetical protein
MGKTQQRYAMLHRNIRDTPGTDSSQTSPRNGLHISPRTHFLATNPYPDSGGEKPYSIAGLKIVTAKAVF